MVEVIVKQTKKNSSSGYKTVFYTFVCGRYFVQYEFRQVCIFYLFFWKTSPLSFCLSVFQFNFLKLYNIYIIIVYVGVRYSVILLSLYKKQFVKTNVAL